MASIYRRGGTLWARVKGDKEPGKWSSTPTPYKVGEEAKAKAFAKAAQERINRRATNATPANGRTTVDDYAVTFFAWCDKEGIVTSTMDRGRFRNLVSPHIGALALEDVRPFHLVEMVSKLKTQNARTVRGRRTAFVKTRDEHGRIVRGADGKPILAPRTASTLATRTIVHGYALARRLFAHAVESDVLDMNPCSKPPSNLPTIIDKCPEQRALSRYTMTEVRSLLFSPLIPPERRIQHAFKALTGLRHGEMAALRWRHYDPTFEPLGRLLIAHSYGKRTKTDQTKEAPVHPTLAAIIAAWREYWPIIYGRAPGPDDLIMPTQNMTMVQANNAQRNYLHDLGVLELRTRAGEFRNRGGHGLRAWFVTTLLAHGAHKEVIKPITHAKKGDAFDIYNNQPWEPLCAEIEKLRFELPDGEVMPFATGDATRQLNKQRRWGNWRLSTARTGGQTAESAAAIAANQHDHTTDANQGGSSRAEVVARLATQLAAAVISGDRTAANRLAAAVNAGGFLA